jgi:hypothetical protein
MQPSRFSFSSSTTIADQTVEHDKMLNSINLLTLYAVRDNIIMTLFLIHFHSRCYHAPFTVVLIYAHRFKRAVAAAATVEHEKIFMKINLLSLMPRCWCERALRTLIWLFMDFKLVDRVFFSDVYLDENVSVPRDDDGDARKANKFHQKIFVFNSIKCNVEHSTFAVEFFLH